MPSPEWYANTADKLSDTLNRYLPSELSNSKLAKKIVSMEALDISPNYIK